MLKRNIGAIDKNFINTDYVFESDFMPLPSELAPPEFSPVKEYDSGIMTDLNSGDVVLYKNYSYSGQVIDPYSKGIPFSTVILMLDGKQFTGSSADANGYFAIKTQTKPDSIVISSAGYKAWEWPASEQQRVFELEPEVKDIDPVILPPGTKKNYSWLLLFLIPMLLKKKSVGKIESGTVIAIGIGAFMFLGFDVLMKILQELGLADTKEQNEYNHHAGNPKSFWSPLFWKAGPLGTKILTNTGFIEINDLIVKAFGPFGDNESQVFAAFKKMRTQSQLSYFADKFQQYQGLDLITWLKGGTWPNDRLDTAEISVITKYFEQLPKYM